MFYKRIFSSWGLDEEHLAGRMSFIAGPRQVGKTTLVKNHLEKNGCPNNYYNWDIASVRRSYAKNPVFFIENVGPLHERNTKRPWVALDEIHKYPKWKNILKGYYDEFVRKINFIVSGSARLDMFRKSGDSLVGRYFLYNMFPMGPKDVLQDQVPLDQIWNPKNLPKDFPTTTKAFQKAIQELMRIGGFPEPFSVGTENFSSRWRDNHVSLIVEEDLRDLTMISQLKKLETLAFLLPERVGSPLSLNSLKNELQCAHDTVNLWLSALDKVYLTFSLSPWTKKLARSILKERKYFFWDWGMVDEIGARFENFIAVSLMRTISAWNELGLGKFKLHYVRTKDGLEVDFLISERNEPYALIECKDSEDSVSPALIKLKEKIGARWAVQVINKFDVLKQKRPDLFVVGVDRLLTLLL